MSGKPMLAVSLERLTDVAERLRVASEMYQRLKLHLTDDPEFSQEEAPQLLLALPGTPLTIPINLAALPADQVQWSLETACDAVGKDIVSLWAQAHEVTTAANEHCRAAQAAAETVATP